MKISYFSCIIWLLAVVLTLLPQSGSWAGTFVFPDEYSNLQDAINAAAVGDTVLVKEGSFGVVDIELKSGISFIGETGDPQNVVFYQESIGHNFFSLIDVDSTTTISGITFDIVHNSLSDSPIEVRNSSPLFRDCIFTTSNWINSMREPAINLEYSSPSFENCQAYRCQYGVFEIKHSSATFNNCSFYDNVLGEEASVWAAVANIESSSVVFQDCLMERNAGSTYYNGVIHSTDSVVMLDSCIIQGNSGEGSGAMTFNGGSTTISNCVFKNNRALPHHGQGGGPGDGGAIKSYGNATIENTVFLDNGAFIYPDVNRQSSGGAIFCTENTSISHCLFYGNEASNGSAIGGSGSYDHCIFAWGIGGYAVSPINDYGHYGIPILSCCCFWSNETGDLAYEVRDQLGVDGNFHGDPGFCDAEAGIFSLCADSPCLPGNLPGGCDELVGLFGAGCDDCDPLPNFLTEFSAQVVSNTVQLHWSVSDDIPENEFRLMRVVDGTESAIAFVKQSYGQFKAVDVFDGRRYGKVATYLLSIKNDLGTWTLISDKEVIIDGVLVDRQLGEVYPNPFNAGTSIALELHWEQMVDLAVFDLQGHRVCVLHEGHLAGGSHILYWNGKDAAGKNIASGSYYIRLISEETVESKAVLLLK